MTECYCCRLKYTVAIYYYIQKTLGTTLLTLEKYFYLHMHLCFFVVFFYCKMSIFTSVFKEFLFAFTIPFTFMEFMKVLLLVKHLLTAGF